MSEGKVCLALFVDFRAAYDRVSPLFMDRIMEQHGVPAGILRYMQYWRTNRYAVLNINNTNHTIKVLNGLGQGASTSQQHPAPVPRRTRNSHSSKRACGTLRTLDGRSVFLQGGASSPSPTLAMASHTCSVASEVRAQHPIRVLLPMQPPPRLNPLIFTVEIFFHISSKTKSAESFKQKLFAALSEMRALLPPAASLVAASQQ